MISTRTSRAVKGIGVMAAILSLSGMAVQAIPIEGSIGFAGSYIPNTTPLGESTMSVAFPVGGQQVFTGSGDYSGLNGTLVAFTGFTFNPPTASVTPLWSFTVLDKTASFDVTSMVSAYDAVNNNWNISGAGTAYMTSKDATAGRWNLTLSQTGDSFTFASTAATTPNNTVPDGGTTAMLMGLTLSGLGFAKRYLTK